MWRKSASSKAASNLAILVSDDTATAKSGLAWTPMGYADLSPSCKKALACCEEVAKAGGAKSAGDFNGKCSGPALWKPEECDTDLKARATVIAADGKPVPDACK